MYKHKQLFRNSNASFSNEATAVESVWAYVHGVDVKKTGRYRIRITKMGAQELIQLGLAPEETPEEFYGIQAYLEKWQELHGWLPLFDWVGDPMSDIESIESYLGKQFQSFVTGLTIESSNSYDFPSPRLPSPLSQRNHHLKHLSPKLLHLIQKILVKARMIQISIGCDFVHVCIN